MLPKQYRNFCFCTHSHVGQAGKQSGLRTNPTQGFPPKTINCLWII